MPEPICAHVGEPCDGRFCEICGAGPLMSGWCFEEDASYRCNADACEPRNLWIGDTYCADGNAAYEASERQGGSIAYWTEWEEGDDDFCSDCQPDCPCRTPTVSEYLIEVDVTVKRIYVVDAKTPLEAMTAYRAGQADVDDSRSEMEDWEEQEHTARIAQDDE